MHYNDVVSFLIENLVQLDPFPMRNSIHTPCSSLYTPLKITIDENTNLPLNLLYTPHLRLFLPHFFLSSAHPFLGPKCVRIARIARMALKNIENGVEISFETVEKEEDEVQVCDIRYNVLSRPDL